MSGEPPPGMRGRELAAAGVVGGATVRWGGREGMRRVVGGGGLWAGCAAAVVAPNADNGATGGRSDGGARQNLSLQAAEAEARAPQGFPLVVCQGPCGVASREVAHVGCQREALGLLLFLRLEVDNWKNQRAGIMHLMKQRLKEGGLTVVVHKPWWKLSGKGDKVNIKALDVLLMNQPRLATSISPIFVQYRCQAPVL